LNIIEPLSSVLETRVRNRFPPPTSLKQLEDVLQEEWYKIPLEIVQNLHESVTRRIAAVLKTNVVQRCIIKEMCTLSIVFPLFCSTPVHTIKYNKDTSTYAQYILNTGHSYESL
jgi:hypothetical protein